MPAMAGPVPRPGAGAKSPRVPAAPDADFALQLGDEQPSAAIIAVALPRELVLARARYRRTRWRLDPELREWLRGALVLWSRRVALALPPLAMLAVALGAAITGISSLAQVVRLVVTAQFAQVAAALDAIDASGRVLLACGGYFALLAALRVLARGLFASGWARLRLLPGLLIALPSAWLFIAGAELAAGAAPLSQIAADWWRALVLALTLHAILLAVVGARPTAPAVHRTLKPARTRREREDDEDASPAEEPSTERLPLVRFGPPALLETVPETDTQVMRVAGLLHTLSSQAEPLEADADHETDA